MTLTLFSRLLYYKNFKIEPCVHSVLWIKRWNLINYEGELVSNQPIPFPMDRDCHDFHALFQYMFDIWVQNCTHIESFFDKILNVKHG